MAIPSRIAIPSSVAIPSRSSIPSRTASPAVPARHQAVARPDLRAVRRCRGRRGGVDAQPYLLAHGTDPVGTRASTDRGETWYTVVGVVGDVKQFGLAQETVAQVYLPLTQTPQGFGGQVLVRTAGDPTAFGQILRDAVHKVDPNQPVEAVQTLDDLRSEALAAPRLTATLLAVFAGLALLVTLAGIGGVIATSVTQRTRECGLRMALGAHRGTVLAMVLRQG